MRGGRNSELPLQVKARQVFDTGNIFPCLHPMTDVLPRFIVVEMEYGNKLIDEMQNGFQKVISHPQFLFEPKPLPNTSSFSEISHFIKFHRCTFSNGQSGFQMLLLFLRIRSLPFMKVEDFVLRSKRTEALFLKVAEPLGLKISVGVFILCQLLMSFFLSPKGKNSPTS